MKKSILMACGLILIMGTPVFAEGGRLDRKGDRIENRLDWRGDRIDHRLDVRAAHAAAHGNFELAERLDNRGDRINAGLDRKGERINDRLDRREERRRTW
jgi:hypothetical protein